MSIDLVTTVETCALELDPPTELGTRAARSRDWMRICSVFWWRFVRTSTHKDLARREDLTEDLATPAENYSTATE
jgi:hypothetical protein